MTTAINVFVITLMVNLALVGFGFTDDNPSLEDLGSVFVSKSNDEFTGVNVTTEDAIDPAEFVASSSNTGDNSQSDFKLIDTLGVARAGLSLLFQFFTAPLMMALALQWPAFLVMFIAIPWMMLFWISLLMVIRGIG